MGIKRAGVKAIMEANPKNRPTDCVISGHCRTEVFEFPGVELTAEAPMQPALIVERPGARATVVSDVLEYFREASPFRHYGICCSLRWKINDALSARAESSSTDRFPLFVVVEQEQECETPLEYGTCYVVDQEAIPGGCAGQTVLIAWHADDAPWPQVEESTFVNTVLAAVKIAQDETDVIPNVVEASCFYDGGDRAVYPMTTTMSAKLALTSARTASEVAELINRTGTLVQAFMAKQRGGHTRFSALVEALRLEKIDTDHYRRAWYLCLFEAIEAVLSGRHKQEFHQQHRAYRNSIGHPIPSTTMVGDEFARLQRDALGPENSWRVPIPVQTQEPPCGTSAVLITTCATTEALA